MKLVDTGKVPNLKEILYCDDCVEQPTEFGNKGAVERHVSEHGHVYKGRFDINCEVMRRHTIGREEDFRSDPLQVQIC